MAEIAAGFLGPAIEGVKWVGAPILRQFNYLCCFGSNIISLKNEAEKLQVTERDLQGKVETARNDVRVISDEVETWLQNSIDIKDEIDGILNEVPNVESGCFKLGARFSLSRRAKKTTDRLKELRDLQCKFNADAISRPRPPAATEVIPSERTYNFESRKKIEEDIMSTLRGGHVNMMGMCGMGGLGKTTMAKRVMNRALEEHVFEEVVMAVVSQPIDKLRIQLEIGGSLGLKLEGETSQARVQKLHARLSGTKRILLVLDDLWEGLVPEDLGIPSAYERCTILLTSRNHDVLSAMNVEKIFGMEVLSVEDSWLLFRMRAGKCVDDTKLNSVAKEVVNECKGLPIALITVGAALKDEVDVDIWKNALLQLGRCDPDIPKFIENVYYPLKLSYDVLDTKYKLVFLLCCLYPEDADIPLEHLTYFCLGLRIFGGATGNVEEARNRIRALTKVLKSRSLLLDSEKGDELSMGLTKVLKSRSLLLDSTNPRDEYVRMHDVVRDVCIFIAKQQGYIGDNNCTWTFHRSELSMGLAVPNLRLLFFQTHKYSNEEFTLENSFLEGIRDLSVICIERYSVVSLPPTTQMLRNLNTLLLYSCRRVETLSVVGELVNLEILICRDCYSIVELPPEIKGLNRLKVLDLTNCRRLQRIGRDVISSLVGLEELKMSGSFDKWEGEEREQRENAGIRELEALTNLRCLEMQIEDLALAVENIRLSSKVDRFIISFLHIMHFLPNFVTFLSKKKMCLNWEGETCLGHWIEMQFLRDSEYLYLVGNGANNVDLTKLENIRCLVLGECESMKNMLTTSMDDGGTATVFPSIEHLNLFKLPKLEEIWDRRVSLNCFRILKELKLNHLPALKQLWKSNQDDLGKDFLPQLEVLEIRECEMMEAVFLWKGEDGNENNSCRHTTKMFPKLKEVSLRKLPNLINFCQGIEGIEFPLMRTILIDACEKMKGMVANGISNENNSGGSSKSNAADTIHLLCQIQQVSLLQTQRNPFCSHTIHVSLLYGLEELIISDCGGSMSLFTSSMAENLVNLQELCVSDCDEMVEVIKDDEEKGMSGGRQRALLFPKLHSLRLRDLPKLVSFCKWKCDVDLPPLRKVEIIRCPNMKNFTLGSLAAPSLEYFKTDLNNYLLQVPFNSLKQLSVFENENPLNCYQIHGSIFDRLEVLNISGYEGGMSLFSSSITGNLVNLTRLTIWNSYEMVKVIENEDEDEKEKVVSGQRTLLFPKLNMLELWSLRKLVSFCERKCDVELPSLRELNIKFCANMKSFTLGHLNTPKLERVDIDSQHFGVVKDLNDILQQRYSNQTKKKQADEKEMQKKKGGAEEQERRGEIEEEQN